MKKIIKVYVHGSKDSMRDTIEDYQLKFKDDEAEAVFLHANSEISIEMEVDTETGFTNIISAK